LAISLSSHRFLFLEHHRDSSNPVPPLQNYMFSLKKPKFVDDSGDSLDDSPRAKAAHKTTQHLQKWIDRKANAIGPICEKSQENQGFAAGRTGNEHFFIFLLFFQFSSETGSKAPISSFGSVYLLSTRLHHHPKPQVVVGVPRRIPVPSSRSALDALD
jgi:hypothetical protein